MAFRLLFFEGEKRGRGLRTVPGRKNEYSYQLQHLSILVGD